MGITFKVETKQDNMPELKRALAELVASDVLVGFPAETATPRTDAGPPMNNAGIAYLNEMGSPAQNIPPRPFLVPGVESVEDEITQHLTDAASAAIEGRPEGVDRGLQAAGMRAQIGVKNFITAGVPPPLAAPTLRQRRMRGFMGTKPLIASGQMLNAVTYVTRKKPGR